MESKAKNIDKKGVKSPFVVVTTIEEKGSGQKKLRIVRPVLKYRDSGLIVELPTAFVFRELSTKSLNTQIATLRDLGFIENWYLMNSKSYSNWLHPQMRLRAAKAPLTTAEIDRFHTWSHGYAEDLIHAIGRAGRGIAVLPGVDSVELVTSDRRQQVHRDYLKWQIANADFGSLSVNKQIQLRSDFVETINDRFDKNITGKRTHPVVRSLSQEDQTKLRAILNEPGSLGVDAHGVRDALIVEIMLAAHLRIGTVLKLYCADIVELEKIDTNNYRSVVHVRRRPNDPAEERNFPPAVKGPSGPISISKRLAKKLISYVLNERARAIKLRADGIVTPYLFVCQSGTNIGMPISDANARRITHKIDRVKRLERAVSPHVLRHTGLTEVADHMDGRGKSEAEIQEEIRIRGQWAVNSRMPELYTARRLQRKGAELTEQRDKDLEPK